MKCNHSRMYFDKGRLICSECGTDRTPYSNVRTVVVFDDFREKTLKTIEKIANDIPEDDLRELELFAEFLKIR